MRNLTVKYYFTLTINEYEIDLFENNNNIVMPKYLKEFFLKYNGTKITESFYKQQYYISNFLSLFSNDNIASVEDFLPWIRDEEFCIGRYDIVPFAIDPGGTPFLVSIGGLDEGVVYYSAVGLDENPLRKLADSFEEFINGLRSEE
jgi:hypothetical protein